MTAQNEPDSPLDWSKFDKHLSQLQNRTTKRDLELDTIGVLISRGPIDVHASPDTNLCAFLTACGVAGKTGKVHPNYPTECAEALADPRFPKHPMMSMPSDMAAWKDFVKAAVRRYGVSGDYVFDDLIRPLRIWQLGPEYPRIWCWHENQVTNVSESPGEDFVYLAQQTREAILEVDPEAVVKMPGIASETAMELALEAGLLAGPQKIGGEVYESVDALIAKRSEALARHHRFVDPVLRSDVFDIADIHLYGSHATTPQRVGWLRANLHSPDVPIWTGEGGGPHPGFDEDLRSIFGQPCSATYSMTVEQEFDNALFVPKYYLSALAAGVDVLAWAIVGHYDTWGCTFGDLALLNHDKESPSTDRTPRPSYFAFQSLSELIGVGTVIRDISPEPSVKAYRVDTPSSPGPLYAVWTNEAPRESYDLAALIGQSPAGAVRVFRLPNKSGEKGCVALEESPQSLRLEPTPKLVGFGCDQDCCAVP